MKETGASNIFFEPERLSSVAFQPDVIPRGNQATCNSKATSVAIRAESDLISA